MRANIDSEVLPASFRSREVAGVLSALLAGESCTVVGIGSVGKSNLLRFLARPDVYRSALGPEGERYLPVYLDLNKLLKRSLWGLAELMLHQLLIEVSECGAPLVEPGGGSDAGPGLVQALENWHERSVAAPTRVIAWRYLDRAVHRLCRAAGLRVIFLVDEFDAAVRQMPAQVFAALRALRDDHKGQLMYVVALREAPAGAPEPKEAAEIEAFEELVAANVVWLGPYEEADARYMLKRLEARHGSALDENVLQALLCSTGGHPGLLRAAYGAAVRAAPLEASGAAQDECRRIWLSLAPEEQRVLAQLASGTPAADAPPTVLARLRAKRMLGGPWQAADAIFSPLFAAFARAQQPSAGAAVQVDRERRRVWVNNRAIEGLSPLEYKFLAYLDERRGEVCTRDEIARELYPHDMTAGGEGVSDARLDAVAKRLKKRIEPVPDAPRHILTVRGHGFRLASPDDEEH